MPWMSQKGVAMVGGFNVRIGRHKALHFKNFLSKFFFFQSCFIRTHALLLVAFIKITINALIIKWITTNCCWSVCWKIKAFGGWCSIGKALASKWLNMGYKCRFTIIFKTSFHDVRIIAILTYSYDLMVKNIHDNTMTLKEFAIPCSVINLCDQHRNSVDNFIKAGVYYNI